MASPITQNSAELFTNSNKVHSFKDIMSEQLAVQLSQELNLDTKPEPEYSDEIPPHLLYDEDPPFIEEEGVDDTTNDLLLAAMLQHEFDVEYDTMLKRQEDKSNGSSKVTVSFNNYRIVHPVLREDSDDDLVDLPEYKIPKSPKPQFNKQGVSGKGKNVVTKHDLTINSIQNANKAMDTFPPGFETGYNLDFETRLPNRIYNELKASSKVESKRSQRNHEKKDHCTQLAACDEQSKLALYKMTNSGKLESLNGIISTGKEAIVLHATGGNFPDKEVRTEVAVKIYMTTLGKFKNRCEYIRGDYRFIKDDFKKQNSRKIIKMWAEKEETNLRRMRRFDLPCPEPIALKNHILVMSFVGKDGVAAPKLAETILTDEQLTSAYEQCKDIMKKMYNECHLVHADMSEFNLLWHEGKVFVIDVAQAVDSTQSKAFEFLIRDCQNLTNFFDSRGLDEMITWQDLFTEITGMEATGEGDEFLSQILNKINSKEALKLKKRNICLSDLIADDLEVQQEK